MADDAYLFEYLYQAETDYVLDSKVLFFANDKLDELRAHLVDLFVLVSHKLGMCQGTLYHMVSLLDRSLSKNEDLHESIQLTAATCLYISAKFEESLPLNIRSMLELIPNSFQKTDIFNLEKELLVLHDFDFHGIDPNAFIRRLVSLTGHHRKEEFRELVFLFYDTLLTDKCYSLTRCSQMSASAVYAALSVYQESWTNKLAQASRYRVCELAKLTRMMLVNVYHIKASQEVTFLDGARLKYSCKLKHGEVLNSDVLKLSNLLKGIDTMTKMIDFSHLISISCKESKV